MGKHEWEVYEPHVEVAHVAFTQTLLMAILESLTQMNYGIRSCSY